MGEAFAMIVLIEIQISLPVYTSVWIVGSMIAIMSTGVVLLISEPKLKKLNVFKRDLQDEHELLLQRSEDD